MFQIKVNFRKATYFGEACYMIRISAIHLQVDSLHEMLGEILTCCLGTISLNIYNTLYCYCWLS